MRLLKFLDQVVGYILVWPLALSLAVTIFLFWVFPRSAQLPLSEAELTLEGITQKGRDEGVRALFTHLKELSRDKA